MWPLSVSCIIPCYNSEKYVFETIVNLLNQKEKPLEIILIDDCSTDNTLNILKEKAKIHENLIRVIKLKNNRGSSYARNYGVRKATGDFILFMDSDDIAHPELISEYIKCLNELDDKEVPTLCYSAYKQIDKLGKEISDVVKGMQFNPGEELGYGLIRNYIMSTSGVLVRKQDFLQVGGFNEEIRYSEDWDLWLRLASIGNFLYVDKPLVKVRRHGENLSINVQSMLDAEKRVLSQYDVTLIKKAILKRNLREEVNIVDYVSVLFKMGHWEDGYKELCSLLNAGCTYYNLYFYLGIYYLQSKDYKRAMRFFHKTINGKKNHGAALNNISALYLLNDEKQEAKKHLKLALGFYPNFIDASENYKLFERKTIRPENIRFTWRELRPVLTSYNE